MKIKRLASVYLLLSGIAINLVVLAALAYGAQQVFALGIPLPMLADKVLLKIEDRFPKMAWVLSEKLGIERQAYENTLQELPDFAPEQFRHRDLLQHQISYDEQGRPVSSLADSSVATLVAKRRIAVSTTKELLKAIRGALAGDLIAVAAGEYVVKQHAIQVKSAGAADAPIVVRGESRDSVRIKLNTVDGFHVKAPFWRFENMTIEGVCVEHERCEHAFHVIGDGRSLVVRDNTIKNFNSAIKVNGDDGKGARRFPDYGLLQNNAIFNTEVRNTSNSVTPVDIVGANEWIVRGNLIADFAKAHGDRVSYAAFMKGNSTDGLFERNLVICEMHLLGTGIRLGLSFGGGGTADRYCRDNDCSTEHQRGTIRNNIIMRCPRDVGIYLNRAASTEIYNNTMHQTLGIDVRFRQSTATIANNVLNGRVLNRDSGYNEQMSNLISSMDPWFWEDGPQDWFVDADQGDFDLRSQQAVLGRGIGVVDGVVDFCGEDRPQSGTDLGAIEYSSDKGCELTDLFAK